MSVQQKITDAVNGESKSKLTHMLIYTLVGMSLVGNMLVIFWHHPFSHLVLGDTGDGYGAMSCLLDTLFIGIFLSSNTFVLLLCTDIALTRIAHYQYPSPPQSKLNVGGKLPETWRHLALCYHFVSMVGLASMVLLGMYGRHLSNLGLSLGMIATIYGVGMASVTMMLLGGLTLAGCALTVHKWKSSLKRCSSVCFPQTQIEKQ